MRKPDCRVDAESGLVNSQIIMSYADHSRCSLNRRISNKECRMSKDRGIFVTSTKTAREKKKGTS